MYILLNDRMCLLLLMTQISLRKRLFENPIHTIALCILRWIVIGIKVELDPFKPTIHPFKDNVIVSYSICLHLGYE